MELVAHNCLDLSVTLVVDVCCRLIHYEKPLSAQERAREAEELSFTN